MKLKKLDMRGFSHDIGLALFVVVFAIIGVGYLVASHADNCNPVSGAVSSSTSAPVCQPVSAPVSGPPLTLAPGEQLSQPPARRPAQYLHVCVSTGITYVSQGTPSCLSGGTFEYDYAPTVAGTVYNVPCESISGSLIRYVYVSSGSKCPSGSTSVVPGSGGSSLAPGEQLSQPPARRPAQYLHLCTTGANYGNIMYVTQGSPSCVPGPGTKFEYDYAPAVPGTYYNVPCETTSGSLLRYVYISNNEACPSGTSPVSGALASGEQLSQPPARRPTQYVHLCSTGANYGNTMYVTQGSPNCLPGPGDIFELNYGPTVSGTLYSVPCETTSGSALRYAYISSTETCPSGTALVKIAVN